MSEFLFGPGSECDNDESPFARDLNGFLVRLDPPTAADYDTEVSLTIDGQSIAVKKAVPQIDAQGALTYRDGKTIPRATTIYDAACQLFGAGNPIPILCHVPHQQPVAVCRVCSVFILRAGDEVAPRKLLPACQHRVEAGMVVYTQAHRAGHVFKDQREIQPGAIVRRTVATLLELLVTDHMAGYRPEAAPANHELADLARRFEVPAPRFPLPTVARPHDSSSPVIEVDPSACILCDRCVRGCNDVRGNFVISRNGKGYTAHIGFDLGGPMGESSCVECGECMISCPTGALTAKQTVRQEPRQSAGTIVGPVAVNLLLRAPLNALFGGLPRKFLEWNAGAVVRRRLEAGDLLFREGEYGSHAFLLEEGSLMARVKAPLLALANERPTGWLSRMMGHSVLAAQSMVEAKRGGAPRSIRTDLGGVSVTADRPETQITARPRRPNLQLIGESACLNNYPYASTVTALEPSVVLEIRRNVLLQMLRVPETRRRINETFRKEALEPFLLRLPLLGALDVPDRLRMSRLIAPQVEFVRVDPGQTIYAQGEPADQCYLVRVGFIRVAQTQSGQDVVLDYIGPGGVFGTDEVLELMAGRTARRTSSCRAMDHVELIRIPVQALSAIVQGDPAILKKLVEAAAKRKRHAEVQQAQTERPLDDYLDRGLYNARNLLVLDLDKCTRCDECTKACADTHNGVTRLIREGLRFENFLVATSCRSCLDPTCMVGCPVDAIHRTKGREIVIEDWCIGCGLCARNCPYGNIHMAPVPSGGKAEPVIKATTCDLCQQVSPNADPSCVYACPHDAAHRMNGRKLLKQVEARRADGPDRGA